MKICLIAMLTAMTLFSNSAVASSDLKSFLKYSAYGAMGGAVAGVASLALTDKPSDHTGNIARGASLGLYAGIGYGIYKMNSQDIGQDEIMDKGFSWAPQIQTSGDISGLNLQYFFSF